MKNTLFVNGHEIKGDEILNIKQQLLSVEEEASSFALTPNENNTSYLNAEALQKIIDMYALVAMAKFEGINVEDEEVSKAVFELRSSYEDETEWEIAIAELGIDDKNIRDIFYRDMMVDLFIQSHLAHYEDPNDDTAEEFYLQNIETMIVPNSYTFIELEAPNLDRLKLAATILSQSDTATISQEAEKYGLNFVLNEDIPHHKLPEPLQEILLDLEESKIGTLPAEEDTMILIKLLRKITGRQLSLEESLPGLVKYLQYQQYKDVLDDLTENAVDKCDIIYYNTEQLKNLK